ncbi:DUF2809 domain-containing protein [Propionibacteriaceae bacterium Y2011]
MSAVRNLAIALLVVVIGCGLVIQRHRQYEWSDPLGTVLYVVAVGLLIMAVRPSLGPAIVALAAGGAALSVELLQWTELPAIMVGHLPVLRLALGSRFSVIDVGWLLVGAIGCWSVARLVSSRLRDRPAWSRAAVRIAVVVAILLLVSGIAPPLPGHLAWAPFTASMCVLVAEVVDLLRGLSRDDGRPTAEVIMGRLVVGTPVALVSAAFALPVVGWGNRIAAPLAAAVVVAWIGVLGAMLAVVAGWRDGVPQRFRTMIGIGAAVAVVAASLALTYGPPGGSSPGPSPITTQPRPTVVDRPTVAPPPPVTPPPPAGTAAADLRPCSVAELDARTQGWDSAMFETWVTVVVTNRSGTPCAVDGLPTVSILQGRTPLELAVDHVSAERPGTVEQPHRRQVDPGGAVSVLLRWDGYRNQADLETPQALTLHAPGIGSIPVRLDQGPAPFDLMDGGSISVSAWR